MSRVVEVTDAESRTAAVDLAVSALARADLVVLPTDTVYGLAADAFSSIAVTDLLRAKGRHRGAPLPVLVGSRRTLDGVATRVSDEARDLVDAFWPGQLTLVCWSQPSLSWDIGASRGTVALRMPDADLALEVLARTGPLAVTSACRAGRLAPTTWREAQAELGDAVSVYVAADPADDAAHDPAHNPGRHLPRAGAGVSTVVDVTTSTPRVLRHGAVSLARLREVVPSTTDASD